MESKIKQELPNIFCLLCIVGYPLSQCFLSPLARLVSDSSLMSWGYHCFSLFTAFLTLWFYRKDKTSHNTSMNLAFVFFLLYAIRAIYDLDFARDHLNIIFAYKLQIYSFSRLRFQTYMYVFLLTIFQLYVFAKIVNKVDFIKVGKWIVGLGFFSLLISSIFSSQDYSFERIDGNTTLKNIGLGNFSSVVCLCSLLCSFQKNNNFVKKALYLSIPVFCMIISLKTASRGPILSMLLCLCIYFLLFRMHKNPILTFFIITAILLFYSFVDYEAFLLKNFPVLYDRLERDNRTDIYITFWNECLRNKAFGFQLDFLGYSHNMIIDSFMMFGFVGGLIVPIICLNAVYLAVSLRNNELSFLAITLLFFFMICNMFSGSLGTNLAFWSTYLCVANFYNETRVTSSSVNNYESVHACS